MNEDDPFIASSDNSGNDKAMGDIDFFLNYKKDEFNQNDQISHEKEKNESENILFEIENESKKQKESKSLDKEEKAKSQSIIRNKKSRRRNQKQNLISNLDLENALKLSEDFQSTIAINQNELKQNKKRQSCKAKSIDLLGNIDLDITEVDVNEISISDQTKDNQKETIHEKQEDHFEVPTSPLEFFEYIFQAYLNESIESFRVSFISEFQNMIVKCFDYDQLINFFISSINIEIQAIFNEFKKSSNEISRFSDITSSVDYLFQDFPNNLKKNNDQIVNDDIKIYENLVQSSQFSFISNCRPLLNELKQNIFELTNSQSKNRNSRIQYLFESKKQEEFDLEAKLYLIQLEKVNIDNKLNKLRRNWHQSRFSSLDYENNSKPFEENKENIEELIENLTDFNIKKRIVPLSTFLNKSQTVLNEILMMNNQLIDRMKQNSMNQSLLLNQLYDDFSYGQYYCADQAPIRSSLANGVMQKLSEMRQHRENQISELYDNYS